MANLTEIQNTLTAVGFTLPAGNQLIGQEAFNTSGLSGFEVVETGGGCKALRRNAGEIYMLLTDEDGADVPDEKDWEQNLIGVYRVSTDPSADDEEIFCMTARELLDQLNEAKRIEDKPKA